MKKRLRKKKKLGEFIDWGFSVDLKFDPPITEIEDWLDRFLEFAEKLDLGCGGGFGPEAAHFYVTALTRPAVKEADRGSLAVWLLYNVPGDVNIGLLEDSNRTTWPDRVPK